MDFLFVVSDEKAIFDEVVSDDHSWVLRGSTA